MKKTTFFVLTAAVLTTLGSCGKKDSGQAVETEPDTVVVSNINRDSTLYGICGDGSAMNTLQLITDIGDTVTVSVAEANDNGRCYGSFQTGDRMAVVLKNKSAARLVINQSALLGDWVMPNPLDGSSEMGIRIKEGGIAESIEQPTVQYRSWRLFNGQLEIVSVREGGSENVETNLYDIVSIGPDSLVYRDAEDVYEYSRYQERRSTVDIELEEASEDDYRM